MASQTILAGWAREELPARAGMALAGYGTKRIASGVHDPLYAKAVVIHTNQGLCGFCVLDVLAVDHLVQKVLAARLEEEGISFVHLLVAAAHTHSAPGGLLDTEEGILRPAREFAGLPDPIWIDEVAHACCQALQKAASSLQPVSLSSRKFRADGIVSNRVNPDHPAPDTGWAIALQGAEKQIVLFSLACHPTVLNGHNLEISVDFCGAACRQLEKMGWDMAVFFNGACGDLSCRYTRMESTFAEAERLGGILARAVGPLRKFTPCLKPCLDWSQVKTEVRTRPAARLESARGKLAKCEKVLKYAAQQGVQGTLLRELQTACEGARAQVLHAEYGPYPPVLALELSVLVLHPLNWKFVFVPAEVFSSLPRTFLGKNTWVVGYTNGYLLYIADQNAYEQGSYEALSSPLEIGQAEALFETIGRHFQKTDHPN